MSDLISRQAAIKAIEDMQDCYNGFSDTYDKACIIGVLEELPSAQAKLDENDMPEQGDSAKFWVKTGETCTDCISRQAAIDSLNDEYHGMISDESMKIYQIVEWLNTLPSAQPTLYGYSIEHLALIATIMQKEHVTPEKALEYFKDIQRMGQMIIDEQQEMIRRAMEKWMI